jgi:hypothetical protein
MAAIRVNRLLPAVVATLALLFAVLEPAPSRGLVFPVALAFWLLHIGIGVLLAVQATERLSRVSMVSAWNPWLRLLAGGLAGSLLFAPVALAIDAVLQIQAIGEPGDDLLDRWEAAGGGLALLAEWLQLAPSYLASWLLLNAVALASGPTLERVSAGAGAPTSTSTNPPTARAPEPATVAGAAEAGEQGSPVPVPDGAADESPVAATADPALAAREAFLAQLPAAIGTDLIAIQSDLHYLQVRTARGRATLLASISVAEAALGATGMRVHRSHWIAFDHVVRVARTARGTFLTLSDGSRVPVSRRRAGEVQARLGRGFVVDPA